MAAHAGWRDLKWYCGEVLGHVFTTDDIPDRYRGPVFLITLSKSVLSL